MELTKKDVEELMRETFDKYLLPAVKLETKRSEELSSNAVKTLRDFLTDEDEVFWGHLGMINELKRVSRFEKRIEALERGGVLPPKSHTHCPHCGNKLNRETLILIHDILVDLCSNSSNKYLQKRMKELLEEIKC